MPTWSINALHKTGFWTSLLLLIACVELVLLECFVYETTTTLWCQVRNMQHTQTHTTVVITAIAVRMSRTSGLTGLQSAASRVGCAARQRMTTWQVLSLMTAEHVVDTYTLSFNFFFFLPKLVNIFASTKAQKRFSWPPLKCYPW